MSEKILLRTAPLIELGKISKLIDDNPRVYECPVCSNNKWVVTLPDTGSVTVLPWGLADGTTIGSGVAIVTLFCSRCGFARLHEFEMLKRYLEERRDGE